MSRNNVRGPTSALTEFLKASGITPTTVAARRAAAEQEQPVAGPSGTGGGDGEDVEMENGDTNQEEEEVASPQRRRTRGGGRGRASGAAAAYDSDELDDPAEEEKTTTTTPAKKRKLSKAAEAKLKAKEKAKGKAKNKKDKDGDYEEDDDDPYRALSTMWGGKGNASPAKPPVGNFEDCARCENQFTVTKYTMAAVPGPGFLCHKCAKSTGNDPFKKPAAPKRKKVPADKRTVVNFEERRFPTLASICIQLITKHIDDVESLGDIGTMNMDAISKALSKNRALTPQNAHLFYSVTNTFLTLYDATNLPSPALTTLIHLNPNLTSLRLDFCGHLNDTTMHTLTSSLPSLTHLELLGPFLVRAPAWLAFFSSHTALHTFRITQSPRFDLACAQALVAHTKDTLVALRLREIGQMDDAFLMEIAGLERVEELDVADPGDTSACSEEALKGLLRAVAGTLRVLDMSRHAMFSDEVLREGLGEAEGVESLVLRGVPLLTNEGVAAFFTGWGNAPLRVAELSRNYGLGGEALVALMRHSGERLEVLGINGWGGVGEEALGVVGRLGRELRRLDVGWVREVDDFVVKGWMEGDEGREVPEEKEKGKGKGKVNGRMNGCQRLSEVKVWGCNKITARCPKKKGVSIYGVESHTVL